jgi:flagellar hook-basal body complex protein FliE
MMDWQIASVAAVSASTPMSTSLATNAEAPSGFTQIFEQGLGQLNADMKAAEVALSDLSSGKATELHDVMISLEKARIGVQTFIQVRNKLLESYQDLMRMQM